MKEEDIQRKIKKIQEDEEIVEQLDKNKSKAKKLLKDKEKMERFLDRLERKLSKVPFAGKYLSDVPVLISLVKAYIDKEYTEIPIGSIIAVISALIYVLSPIDMIPDIIPGIGLVDDAAVIATIFVLIHDDVEEYKAWRSKKKIDQDDRK